MADRKTSEETDAGTLTGAELVAISAPDGSGGYLDRRTTAQDIADLASPGGGGAGNAVASDVTTIAGTTAGHAYCQQVVLNGGAMQAMVQFSGYRNSSSTPQTWSFPTAFARTPLVFPNSDPACTADASTLTLPANMSGAIDDTIIITGF